MAPMAHTQLINRNVSYTYSYNCCTFAAVSNSGEDKGVMQWLSPLESDETHHVLRNDRFEAVGDWLFGTREFREWSVGEGGADEAVLFCSGNPGVGKTHLR